MFRVLVRQSGFPNGRRFREFLKDFDTYEEALSFKERFTYSDGVVVSNATIHERKESNGEMVS